MLTCDPILGWLCFYCDISASRPSLDAMYKAAAPTSAEDGGLCDQAAFRFTVIPRDSFRKRMYIAAHDLHVEVEGVHIVATEVTQGQVMLSLATFEGGIERAHLTLKNTANAAGNGTSAGAMDRGIGPFRCRIDGNECEQDKKHGKFVVQVDKRGATMVEILLGGVNN